MKLNVFKASWIQHCILLWCFYFMTAKEGEVQSIQLHIGDSLRLEGRLSQAAAFYKEGFGSFQGFNEDSFIFYFPVLSRYMDVAVRIGESQTAEDLISRLSGLPALFGNPRLQKLDVLRWFRSSANFYRDYAYKPYKAYDLLAQAYSLAVEPPDVSADVQSILLTDLSLVQNIIGLHAQSIHETERFLMEHQELAVHNQITLNGTLGEAYARIGAYAKSRDCYTHRYRLATASGDYTPSELASILMDLGIAMNNCSFPDSAQFYYSESLRLLSTEKTYDRITASRVFNNLGNCLLSIDQYEKSLNAYKQSISLRALTGDPEGLAKVFFNIGLAYSYLEKPDSSLTYYYRSISSRANQLQEGHIHLAESYFALGKVFNTKEQKDSALFWFQKGVYSMVQYFDHEFYRLPLLDRIEIGSRIQNQLNDYFAFIHSLPEPSLPLQEGTLNLMLKFKNNLLLKGINPGGQGEKQTVFALKAKLDSLSVREDYVKRSELIREIEYHERMFLHAKPNASDLEYASLYSLKKALPAGVLFLFMHRPGPEDTTSNFIYILSSNGFRLYKQLARRPREESMAEIMCKVLNDFHGVKKIRVCLDPDLSNFSFESLRIPCRLGRFLFDILDIEYYLNPKEAERINLLIPVKKIFIFGDPNVNPGFNSLPAAGEEIDELSRKFNQKHWGVHVSRGREFGPEAILSSNTAGIIHFASHSLVEEVNTEACSFFVPLEAYKILSGSAPSDSTSFQSQYISAYQVSSLDFSAVNLVVLSGCKSNVSTALSSGNQVLSLSGAFLMAGAKNVIASLWNVSDRPTHEFMQLFYTNMLNGMDYRHAVKRAKMALKAKYPEPEFWAPFILLGSDMEVQDGNRIWPYAMGLVLFILFFAINKKHLQGF